MMDCREFEYACRSGRIDAESLGHLRACQRCLGFVSENDPDLLFRAVGGEIEPPGGLDDFVGGVMSAIHVRDSERALARQRGRVAPFYRWSLAAALFTAMLSLVIVMPREGSITPPVAARQVAASSDHFQVPMVEEYASAGATIIEVPTEEENDLKIVMIFDESLPVDL